jgi:predicted DNA-binding transcriptional regulator YafY
MTSEKNLLRQIFIINQIRGFGYITLKELEDQLYENGHHNSVNTMKRDFEALCKMGYIIKYNYQQKGYCIVSNSELTKHIDRYAEEFELYLALNSVQGFSDFVYPEFRRPGAIAKMRPFLNAIRSMKYIQFLYQKYSNRNTGFLVTDPSHSENVFESLGGNTESLRVVAPYFLKEFRGLWYLICKDDKDKQIKSFALDRISDVKDVGLSFNKDESFNLIKKYRNCFGIYCPKEDSKPEEVILSFDAENGRYLKANPLHHSQKILMDTEEEFRISLFLYITLDFLQEILTRTWSLRVISPESLREKVCEIWKEALERNE